MDGGGGGGAGDSGVELTTKFDLEDNPIDALVAGRSVRDALAVNATRLSDFNLDLRDKPDFGIDSTIAGGGLGIGRAEVLVLGVPLCESGAIGHVGGKFDLVGVGVSGSGWYEDIGRGGFGVAACASNRREAAVLLSANTARVDECPSTSSDNFDRGVLLVLRDDFGEIGVDSIEREDVRAGISARESLDFFEPCECSDPEFLRTREGGGRSKREKECSFVGSEKGFGISGRECRSGDLALTFPEVEAAEAA